MEEKEIYFVYGVLVGLVFSAIVITLVNLFHN
jgi:tetrahydromethanopterin S-methyltransferase subunit G